MYASGAFAAPAAASSAARPGLALLNVVAGPLVRVPGLHLGQGLALALSPVGPGLILRPLLATPTSTTLMMLPLLLLLRGHCLKPVGAVVALESAHICLAVVVAAADDAGSAAVAKLTRRLELVARWPHSVLGVIGGPDSGVVSEGRVEAAAVVSRHHAARGGGRRHLLIPGGGAETNLKLQRGRIRKASNYSHGR